MKHGKFIQLEWSHGNKSDRIPTETKSSWDVLPCMWALDTDGASWYYSEAQEKWFEVGN